MSEVCIRTGLTILLPSCYRCYLGLLVTEAVIALLLLRTIKLFLNNTYGDMAEVIGIFLILCCAWKYVLLPF